MTIQGGHQEGFYAEYTVRSSGGNLCVLLTAWIPNVIIRSKDVEVRFIMSSASRPHKTLFASGPMVIYDDPGNGATLYGAVIEEGRPGVSAAFKLPDMIREKVLIYQVLVTRKGALLKESDPESAVIYKSPEYYLDVVEGIRERFQGSAIEPDRSTNITHV